MRNLVTIFITVLMLMSNNLSGEAIKVSWDVVPNADYYTIEVRRKQPGFKFWLRKLSDSSTYIINDIETDMVMVDIEPRYYYFITLTVFDKYRRGHKSNTIKIKPSVKDKKINPKIKLQEVVR